MNTATPPLFQPSPIGLSPFTPKVPEPATERPKRRAGGKKAAKPKKARTPRAPRPTFTTAPIPPQTAAPAPKKARKPRVAPPKRKAAAPSAKLGINEIVSATVGLKAEEAKMLLSIVGKLNDFNKAGKLKVVGALGKLFG